MVLESNLVPMLKGFAKQAGVTVGGRREEVIERILDREDRLWRAGLQVPGVEGVGPVPVEEELVASFAAEDAQARQLIIQEELRDGGVPPEGGCFNS